MTQLTRQVDTATQQPSQKPSYNMLTFIFLLKRCRFNFFFKNDPITQSKSETQISNRTSLKTITFIIFFYCFIKGVFITVKDIVF